MPSRLSVYNLALSHLGKPRLNSLNDNREERRDLDALWDDAVAYCLERGQWKFAMKAVEIEASPSVEPAFGYANAFEIPDDRVRIAGLSTSDYFDPPLTQVEEEADFWYADQDTLYVRYVSNATDYGLDLSRWSATFAAYVAARLAMLAYKPVTQKDSLLPGLVAVEKLARKEALSADAMQGATRFMPQGSWVASRTNGFPRSRYDRG